MDTRFFSEAAIANPLIVFRMIRRFAKQIPLITDSDSGIGPDTDAGNYNDVIHSK